jgi:hypothetical protein
MSNVYRIFAGRPEWKRSLWKHRHKWMDNIPIVLRKKVMRTGSQFN